MNIILILLFQLFLTLFLFIYCRRKLVIQIIALRHQLSILLRQKKKPKLRNRDRFLWVWLSRIWTDWKEHLVIVKPETVIKWHRQGFSRFWRWKSRTNKVGRPKIPWEHIKLIRRISKENPSWGEDKIADELELKIGIRHSTSTIRRYMVKRKASPEQSQRWRTFIKNHADQIFACDFVIQYTIFFHIYYIFAVMEISTRRIVHFNLTAHPSLDWVKQQLREATGEKVPRFIIHDNDGIYGQYRAAVRDSKTGKNRRYRCALDYWLAEVMSIRGIPTPYKAPNANAHLERWVLSLRTEALNHFVFLSEKHLQSVVAEYVTYYNRARPSQAIHAIPDPYPELRETPRENGEVIGLPVLGGIHHDYRRAA